MTNIALLVGIDDYDEAPLTGCVNDATRMRDILSKNEDRSPNFDCRVMGAGKERVTAKRLRKALTRLFSKKGVDIALFFFAGHGTANNLGGYLVTADASAYDEGVRMADVVDLANQSPARECVIILDCCHSGAFGNLPAVDNRAVLSEGVSVLAASRDTEAAVEMGGSGLFTILVCNALEGGGADVCGKVTVASVYAYADEILSGWDQRPLFKAHVSQLARLRRCAPAVPLEVLRLLPKYFSRPAGTLQLDPSYEPSRKPHNKAHEEAFGHLQMMNRAQLVTPVGEEHMYYAAVRRGKCRLTPLGRFYWGRVNSGKV